MDNETIAAVVGFVIFGVLIFVSLFTIARILMRDKKVRQVRIGFYMERDRDRYQDDEWGAAPRSEQPTVEIKAPKGG